MFCGRSPLALGCSQKQLVEGAAARGQKPGFFWSLSDQLLLTTPLALSRNHIVLSSLS